MPDTTAALAGESTSPTDTPWMARDAFPDPPDPQTYGYRTHKHTCPCTREELEHRITLDKSKSIQLVWEPGGERLQAPEELPWLFPALLERERASINIQGAISRGITVLWGFSCILIAAARGPFPVGRGLLFLFVVMGLIHVVEHAAALHRLRTAASALFAAHIPQSRYQAWRRQRREIWTNHLLACVMAVALGQALAGVFGQSLSSGIASLPKPVLPPDAWRLLAAPLLHNNLLHLVANIASLLILGRILETTFHRAFVPLVFVVSALAAGLVGLLLPDGVGIGSSGGILGLLGCLLVFARHRRDSFPPTLRRDMLEGAVFAVAAALSGFPLVENAALLGGLLAGALLGTLLVRGRQLTMPTAGSGPLLWAGYLAGGAVLLSTALCLYLLAGPGR